MKNLIKHYKKTLILLSVFFCFIFLLIYSFYSIIFYEENIYNKPGNIILYDRNGELITDKMTKGGYYVKLSTVGSNPLKSKLVKSILKIEDKNYYNHYGINILSKLRAIRDNLSGKQISGASTITEQYIKNKYFKGVKRTYLQKTREAILAIYFNFTRDKDYILDKYINSIYLGNHNYGVGAAIKTYFNKDKVQDLTDEEITILISLIHNPSIKYLEEKSFRNYFEKIKKRLGFEFERTYFGKLETKKNIDIFPFVTNYFLTSPQPSPQGDGVTTIDARLQEFTKKTIEKNLNNLAGKNVTNAAVFAIYKNPSIPLSGEENEWEVLIYQGSRDFNSKIIDGQVDVIQASRQPGSTVKPFLYLMALEKGFNPDDLIVDLVSEYNSFVDGKTYISENYSLKEFGLVRLKKALGNSLNNASVRLGAELGLEKVYNFYKKYGFEFDYDARHYGYSLVLGNAETTLEKLVRNYAKLLITPPSQPSLLQEEGVKSNINKFLLQDILSDPDNRDISFGVNSILNTSIPQAVKTGTSSDFRDNWVISYHPDLVVGVWVGNNDNSSMIGVTGITGAGAIWHSIIEKAIELGYIKSTEGFNPLGIVEDEYCLDKNCFEKELIYKKKGKKYYSRIRDNYFSKKDLKEKLTEFEKDKLKKMGIIVK